jgi:hypothetical protein
MTGNQISYARFLEDQRHNIITESLQERNLAEIARHNTVTESQGWSSIMETARSNKAREAISWATLTETKRHNLADESTRWYQAQITASHYNRMDAMNQLQNDRMYWLQRGKTESDIELNWAHLQLDYAQYEQQWFLGGMNGVANILKGVAPFAIG